ncbi:MAG: PAS domain-containing protein [Sphingomonadaceae bacterium]|nr:PAS domain-containing protein [Sphingomonadaceae bacterium]
MTSTPLRRPVPDARPAALLPEAAVDLRSLAAVAVQRTRMPMVVADPRRADCPIVFANQAFLDKTGYAADEVIGRNCRFLQGPDTDPEAVDAIRAAIADCRDLTIELLNYRRDGSSFWNQLMLSPIIGDDGAIQYFFASQLDVTGERRARGLAAREHLLLREVDHRAKNALALVQGIVRLSRADDPDRYSRAVQGRVDALAQAHVVLSDAEWRDVAIDRVIAAVAAGFGSPVTAEGPALTVAAAHVQPLILALHEVLTNAVDHGALSTAAGRVTIRWQADGEKTVVDMIERGGPVPRRAVPRYGLGMTDAVVIRQLQGRIERDWHPRGLTTRIAFPRVPPVARPQ